MILIHEIIRALSILYMDNYRNCIPSPKFASSKYYWYKMDLVLYQLLSAPGPATTI